MLKPPRSLQGRLLLLVLGTSLLVWLLAAVLTWRDARHELDELLDSHLAQSAALLVAQGADVGDDIEQGDAPILHRYAPKVAFQVFHDGKLAVRSANAPTTPMVPGAKVRGFHSVALQGQTWRVFATRGGSHDDLVFVGERVQSRDEILWAVLRSMLWPMAIALPLLAAAGWWAVRQGVQPLRALGRALANRDAEDLRPVQLAGAPTEMLPVLAALDTLFERIARLLEHERRFTGDAAHELRTPIAAIRAQAQVALGATSDAERQHALLATLAGCDRASHLVQQLLTLSRLEASGAAAQRTVDVGAVAQRVAAELAPTALGKQQELSLETQAGCRVLGDETLLGVLVRNLADNAVRYSPGGARIALQVAREQGQVVVSVDDSGPGLAPDDLARLGQRFFRVTGNEAAGSGLGWSIAQRIAAAHHGRLEAARSPALGGLRVRAVLPGAPDAAMRK